MKCTTGGDGIKDDELRRRQLEAERRRDRRWDAAHRHREWRPDGFRGRAFAEENSRIALAMLLLREGEPEEAVVRIVTSMLHLGDPLILPDTESAVCAAQNTVGIALMRLGQMFPVDGPVGLDDEDDDDDR